MPQLLATADVKLYVNLNDATDHIIAPLPYLDESGVLIRFVAYTGELELSSNVDANTYTASGKNGCNTAT